MQPVESGRNRISLQSSPHPTRGETAENICYCPDCGARLRLTGLEPESVNSGEEETEGEGDRTTLPDWLPASGTGSVPPPVVSPAGIDVAAVLKASEPEASGPKLSAQTSNAQASDPLLSAQATPIAGLPNLGPLLAASNYVDEDEPTRVIRISTELPRATLPSFLDPVPPAAAAHAHDPQGDVAHAPEPRGAVANTRESEATAAKNHEPEGHQHSTDGTAPDHHPIGAHAGRKPPVPVRRRSASELSPSEQRIVAAPAASQPAMAAASPVTAMASGGTASEAQAPETLRTQEQTQGQLPAPAQVADATLNLGIADPQISGGTDSPAPIAEPSPQQLYVYGSTAPIEMRVTPQRRKFSYQQAGFGLGIVVAGAAAILLYRQAETSSLSNQTVAAEFKAEAKSAPGEARPDAPVVKIMAAQAAPAVAEEAVSSAVGSEQPSPNHDAPEVKPVAVAKTESPTPRAPVAAVARAVQPTSVGARTQATQSEEETAAKSEPRTKSEAATKQAPAAKTEEAKGEPFDAESAASALESAAERASTCRKQDDPSGVAVVTITFAPSGRVTTANIAGPPFVGTPTGSCIAATMRGAKISAFSGKHVTVRKTVTIR